MIEATCHSSITLLNLTQELFQYHTASRAAGKHMQQNLMSTEKENNIKELCILDSKAEMRLVANLTIPDSI